MLGRRGPLLRDAVGREPHTRGMPAETPVVVQLGITGGGVHIDMPSRRRRRGRRCRGWPSSCRRCWRPGWLRLARRAVDLPLIGRAEQALLDAINDTHLDRDRTATIDALFHAQVERTPDAPALSSGNRTLTYRQLEDAGAQPRRPSLGARRRAWRPRRHRPATRRRHGRRRARDARPRRGLPAARSDVPDRAPRVHGRRRRHQCAPGDGRDGERAGPSEHPGPRPRHASIRRDRPDDGRARPLGPRLRHLHVRLDGHPQGRDARAPPGDQLLRRHGPRHRRRAAGRVAGRHQPVVRHLGARAAVDRHPRLPHRAEDRPWRVLRRRRVALRRRRDR